MALRIIHGRAGCGKSFFCFNDIKTRLSEGAKNPLILIVPEQFSFQTERKLLKTLGATGANGAEVLSFRRLAYRVFNEVGGLTHDHINPAGKSMLLYHIIDRLKEQLKVFNIAARQKGFVSTLNGMISEMKRHNVTPLMLEDIRGAVEADEALKDKLEDIGLIFSTFENTLHQRYIDADDDLTMLAQRLPDCTILQGAEIWIDEFAGFTPQEYAVIEKLLHKAVRVNITLNTDGLTEEDASDDTEVFAPTKSTSARLLRAARNAGAEVETPVSLSGEGVHTRLKGEIGHLEKNIFALRYERHEAPTRQLSIFSANNMHSEVEEAARTITALCRDKGLRYRDIAVVTGNLPTYQKIVEVIFSAYDIPYFIDQKREIVGHPLVLLVLSAFQIFTNNWSYEAVFRYLKTGLTGINKEEIDLIENYVLANGIRGNKWTKEEPWRHGFRHREETELTEYEQILVNRVNDTRKRVAVPLIHFHEKAKGRKKCREWCIALFDFLCEIGVPERIEDLVEQFKQNNELDLANEYGQIWNILMEVLDQGVEVLGEETINLEKFQEVLTVGFAEYQIGLIPPSVEQVLVGSIERSRTHEVKALFILGVNDGIFPAASKEEGILSDRDRDKLKALGMELAKDTRSRTFEQQYLVYTALTTPSDYMRLSYPIADSEGRTLRPSIVLSKIKRIFPNIHSRSNIIRDISERSELRMITTPASTFMELISEIRRESEGFEINPLWHDVYRWYSAHEQWRQKCEEVLQGFTYTNQVAHVSPEKVKKLYGANVHTSVSKLEKYATCPFAYYIQYGLKAEERKIFKLNAPDLGTFLHSVLDKFSKHVEEQGMTWRDIERDWCSDTVAAITDELVSNMSASVLTSTKRHRYLTNRLKRVLTRALWLIIEHIRRSGFEPAGYEIGFGKDEKLPPITIELPTGEKIILTGRIDRIDMMKDGDNTYLRIIDYKSGNKSFKLSDVYHGLQIQLITYLDAIHETGMEGVDGTLLPAGMLYFKIDDPLIKGSHEITEEEIEKQIMKQLKMRGLLLADVKVIREMDRHIEGDSLIIPARINKGDVLGRSSAATLEQFELLRGYVKKLLVKMGQEMLTGNVSISPYKKKRFVSCEYCEFPSICQFDTAMKDNKYRILKDRKDEEVWTILEQEKTEGGDA